ncbi:MAG TPA: 30S ribosomal protein S1 [Chloroflexota bacterium]|nr:30S ribosomal protein S1 [Chloroflexota bacterium]
MSDEKNEVTNAADVEMAGTPLAEEQAQQASEPQKEEHGPSVDYSRTFRELTEGDVVGGVVVHIDKEGVLVDVGTKSEGIIRLHELARDSSLTPEEVVAVGDHIDVYVMETESHDGNLILSKKRADFEKAWERVEQAMQEGKTLTAMVSDRVKGGLVVDLGIRGFVPASHVGSGKVKNLDKYVGQSIPLRVIEVDRERRKVVLSNRVAVDDEREKQKAETLATLAEGQIRDGIVRRVTDYGAFIDLGGIDGLLHISEMSWTRIQHPSEVVKVGQKLQVMVLKLNLDQNKVSLGLRQILPDPWADVSDRYHVSDVITAPISRLVPFGAFVQLEGGIEGIIPNSELAYKRVSKPEDIVQVGQTVEIKILDLRPEERRMTLSLKALQQAPPREQREPREPQYTYTQPEHRTTIADLVGDVMNQRKFKRLKAREAQRAEEEAAAEDLASMEAEETEPMFPDEPVAPEAEAETTAEVEAEATPEVEAEAAPEVEAEAAPEAEAAEEAPAAEAEAVEVQAPEVEQEKAPETEEKAE